MTQNDLLWSYQNTPQLSYLRICDSTKGNWSWGGDFVCISELVVTE